MNNLILPPKRYEDPYNPKYDPIRHKPWFPSLMERREKIPMLQMAYRQLKETNHSQLRVAEEWGVDPRELRDFINFTIGKGDTPSKAFQACLNDAYFEYCIEGAMRHIGFFIEKMAPFYGLNPRHVREMWEVDPEFYPKTYVKR